MKLVLYAPVHNKILYDIYTQWSLLSIILHLEQTRKSKPSMISGLHRDTPDLCSFGILRSRVVASYQHFGTTYQSHFQGSSSEPSIKNYHSTLNKIPKQSRSQVKTKFLIPVRHKLCYHACLNIQFHVNHMAPSNHTKMERNLTTVLTHDTYTELMESKLSETYTVHSPIDAHLSELWLKFTLKLDGSHSAQHTIRTPYQGMLPHYRITNNDITSLNVLISI